MSYEAVWKVLEEIIIELRKKGVATPPNVMNDLKSAKVLMKVLDASERDRGDTAPKIEQYFVPNMRRARRSKRKSRG